MSTAKKYTLREGWTAANVGKAIIHEIHRLESLGHKPGFCIIEFDADEGSATNDKKHVFTGFYTTRKAPCAATSWTQTG